jgi:hypothetical protein
MAVLSPSAPERFLLFGGGQLQGMFKLPTTGMRDRFIVNAGVSLEKIAALAGHESVETTRRYCEPSLQDLQQAVEMVNEEE